MKALGLLVLLGAAMLPAGVAKAERLVTGISSDIVSITSSFAGQTMTLFGNIEPEAGAADRVVTGPFNVIVVVTGPLQDRVARLKQQRFGLWMNTEQVTFRNFPTYYQVLASGKLTDITDQRTLDQNNILPEDQTRLAAQPGQADNALFGRELVRLMTEDGHFGSNENGVLFRSESFYSAQVTLPSDAPPGPYLAHTMLFKAGQLLAERSDGFSVRKTGFERFLGFAALQQPLLYGLTTVVLAIFTGWLGGVVFRR